MAESAGSALTWPDFAILAASLAALVVIGGAFSREQQATEDFFLARRRIPWWAACLSFLATEISAVTIIAVPATAYSENWEYGQFFVGSSLAKFAVAFLFIPAFYRFNCTTIYEFLLFRFGQASQVTSSIFFFITRLLGSGVRLMAAALAVAVLIGWPLWATIALFTVVSIAYIGLGGVKAVVWTNVFQATMFLLGGALTVGFLVWRTDGGIGAMVGTAAEAGRLSVINWGPAPGAPDFWHRVLTDPNIFWLAILNGFVGSMAAFGTDFDLMQRLLTVETRGESQRTLSLTPLGTLVTLLLYLAIGAGLFTYYAQHPGVSLPRPDEIFPYFIRTVMPVVLRGVMLTAIVLASIDSPLGSLSASFVTDIYRPLIAPGRTARLGFLLLRQDPLARLQDRGGYLRLPPRRLPPGAPHPAAGESRQRGRHDRHGRGQPRAPRARRGRRHRLCLVVAGHPGHGGHHGAGAAALPGARSRPPFTARGGPRAIRSGGGSRTSPGRRPHPPPRRSRVPDRGGLAFGRQVPGLSHDRLGGRALRRTGVHRERGRRRLRPGRARLRRPARRPQSSVRARQDRVLLCGLRGRVDHLRLRPRRVLRAA